MKISVDFDLPNYGKENVFYYYFFITSIYLMFDVLIESSDQMIYFSIYGKQGKTWECQIRIRTFDWVSKNAIFHHTQFDLRC